jgi:CubicO group peptidase (beta-lactamase class C family)
MRRAAERSTLGVRFYGADMTISSQQAAAGNAPAIARQFTITGATQPALSWIDELFHWFMQASHIRAGTLAIVRDGNVMVHRGYTLAHEGYPITHPDSRFRLASLSKILTCAAIARLCDTARLSFSTQAFPFLGISHPPAGMIRDSAMDAIGIRELVDHTAGLLQGVDDREISHKLGLRAPPTRQDIVRYVYGTPRLRVPGEPVARRYFYSNYGYVILTSVVERAVPGTDFLTFLHREILGPRGLTDLFVGRTTRSGVLPGEVTYDAEGTGLSRFEPDLDKQEPVAYGGDFILENSEGTGGLVSTALTMARLISQSAVWGTGGRAVGRRYGSFPGSWTCAKSLANGTDFVFMFNRDVSAEAKDSFTEHLAQFLDPDHHPRPEPPAGWVVHA